MSEVDWSKAPEGATHYQTEADIWYKQTHAAYQWDCGQWIKLGRSDLGEYALRELVERSAPVEWNGTGLPPVGTVCDYRWGRDKWITVEVFAVKQNGSHKHAAIFDFDWNGVRDWSFSMDATQFRPIRTPEQIAAEERERAVQEMLRRFAIYDIPQVPWDNLFKQMYDAGLRFTEEPKP